MNSTLNATAAVERPQEERIALAASMPFIVIHLLCFAAIWTGVHTRDVLVGLALFWIRMWGITAGYHRYFSHRTYQTSRVFQFVIALIGGTSAQKGALWWAAHHRHHHRESDQADDIHSPVQKGFWWSHVGWVLAPKYNETRYELIKDFARFPELVFLNKHHLVPPVALGFALWLWGGWSMLIVGFFWSTVALWHATFTINSLSHVFGKRRYKTTDTSRNNWLLALLTLGEGWHNNHHYHQNTANQGWFWWEVDVSFYTLKVLSWMRVVKKLRVADKATKFAHLRYSDEDRARLAAESTFFGRPVPASTVLAPAAASAMQLAKERMSEAVDKAAAAASSIRPTAPTPGAAMLRRQ